MAGMQSHLDINICLNCHSIITPKGAHIDDLQTCENRFLWNCIQ